MAHDEAPTPKQNVEILQIFDTAKLTATPPTSGGVIFMSGGAVIAVGSAGTPTVIGVP